MRGQQVNRREWIPNTNFVTLSTYFYVGARMIYLFSQGCCIYEHQSGTTWWMYPELSRLTTPT